MLTEVLVGDAKVVDTRLHAQADTATTATLGRSAGARRAVLGCSVRPNSSARARSTPGTESTLGVAQVGRSARVDGCLSGV